MFGKEEAAVAQTHLPAAQTRRSISWSFTARRVVGLRAELLAILFDGRLNI
jgi:hypothetical protein